MSFVRHPASFRDPLATVFNYEGRILRGLTETGAKQYQFVKSTGLLNLLENNGDIVQTQDDLNFYNLNLPNRFVRVLEHKLIPFISFPYEWSFSMLKAAALLHLDIQLKALQKGIVLSDGSAYNIQFCGVKPTFIDIMSFRPYKEGDFWFAHRQFCEQFLNPLLLWSLIGVPHNNWYRGALEGIDTEDLAALLPARSWLSPRLLIHVLLPARNQRLSAQNEEKAIRRIKRSSFPKKSYHGFIDHLRNWIAGIKPLKTKKSTWEEYNLSRTYQQGEVDHKRSVISGFVSESRPRMVWDFGCNDGEFLSVALKAGAETAVGFDADHGALEKAYSKAKALNLNILPLYQDAANPSAGQGWLNEEREPIKKRGNPDAVFALAFIHHLAIRRNIPLQEIVGWLVDIAPQGIIEFVQKSDPTIQRMMSLKGDMYPDYNEIFFRKSLESVARIVGSEKISETNRKLYIFQR